MYAGVYYDGHERAEVAEYRKQYLSKLHELETAHLPPPDVSDDPVQPPEPGKKVMVIIDHDESSYNANDDEPWMWADEKSQKLRPKSRGAGIMVSDFVTEVDGWLRLTDEEYQKAKRINPHIQKEARVTLEYGEARDGWWVSDKFLKQMDVALDIVDAKYPKELYTCVFLIDHAPSHMKMGDDALCVQNMNVNPGGKKLILRDTSFTDNTGQVQQQSMYVMKDGVKVPKGMKLVLEERGIDTKGMISDSMAAVLSQHSDFKYEKPVVQRKIESRGHLCFFSPKFHCELKPIEQCWGFSKRETRARCNYSITGLRKNIRPSLDGIPLQTIRKYFRKVRDYSRAYMEGNTAGKQVEKAVKLYKSHRRVSDSQK